MKSYNCPNEFDVVITERDSDFVTAKALHPENLHDELHTILFYGAFNTDAPIGTVGKAVVGDDQHIEFIRSVNFGIPEWNLYNDATGQMPYDRESLNKAIPTATIDGTDPQGLLSGDEQHEWNDGYEQALAVIRAEFRAGQHEFTEGQVMEAIAIASEAWDTYCGLQGDVAMTISAVRTELELV